jgi:hypothetical protein
MILTHSHTHSWPQEDYCEFVQTDESLHTGNSYPKNNKLNKQRKHCRVEYSTISMSTLPCYLVKANARNPQDKKNIILAKPLPVRQREERLK